MNRWQVLATLVAILFGTHNLFVKRAAGRIPDVWGAFVLEAVAAIGILVFAAVMLGFGKLPAWPADKSGVAMAAIGGLFIAAGSILYFWVFRLGAPLSAAVPWVLTGWVVVAVLLGLAFEHEALHVKHAAGLACAVAAIWLLK